LLGDHWLGEKELFYDTVQRVPLIVYDPTTDADATRGKVELRMVSAVDIAPTILESLGLPGFEQRIEGRSLLPLLRSQAVDGWRDFVVSELDYSFRQARRTLKRATGQCRAWMVREARWKYVHWEGFRPQLFDLESDPSEYFDLGADTSLCGVRDRLHTKLLAWHETNKRRVTVGASDVEADTDAHKKWGVFFGEW
jgi:arylsulfatase A-like enzyme